MKEAVVDFTSELKRKIKGSNKGVLEKIPIDVYVNVPPSASFQLRMKLNLHNSFYFFNFCRSVHTMLTDLIARCVFSIKVNQNSAVAGTSNENELSRIVKEIVAPPNNLHLDLMMWPRK